MSDDLLHGQSRHPTERVAWVLNQPGLGRHQKYSKMHRRRVGAGKTLCGVTIPDAVPSSVGKGDCKRCSP